MKTFSKFKRLLALLALSGAAAAAAQLHAQETPVYKRGATVMENTMPPSPEPASAVKYADVPFSHSQGLATLDILLHTLKGRELTIPIGLSYATGGIKMDETAGVAGLGWSLNAGGCVTRTVMDMPDEFSAAAFHHAMPSSSLLARLEAGTSDNETMAYLRDILWHRVDASLDRYSYSVCGLSGSFVILDNRSVFLLSGDGVEITPTFHSDGYVDFFTLVGPDGTTYKLSVHETGHHDGSSDHQFTPTSGEPDRWDAVTAWYLETVTSRSGLETAEFGYSDSAEWKSDVWARMASASFKVGAGREEWSSSDSGHYIASSHDVKVLTYIKLSGYEADFTYATDTGSSNHYVSGMQPIRNFPFRLTGVSVRYGEDQPFASVTVGTARAPYDGRIVLNSLRMYRGTSLDDRWDFSYKTVSGTVSHYSQDWFGYYNGEDDEAPHTRRGLCPFIFSPSFSGITLAHGYPDASKASYMSLLSADHDGARTEFTYEGAAVDASGTGMASITAGVRVFKIMVTDNGTLVRARKFTYEDAYTDGPSFPLAPMYTTVSASLSEEMSQSGAMFGYHNWSFGLHENPVTEGPSIRDTRAFYGKVTEDISGNNMHRPIVTPVPLTVPPTLLSLAKYRTVRYFSMNGMRYGWTGTLSRFPSRWQTDYTSSSTVPSSVDPFTGIRDGYTDAGPAAPALLTRQEEYSGEDDGNFTLLSATDYTYGSDLSRGSVLTDYRAVQVMQRILYGDLQMDDIYHYPVLTRSCPGKNPTSEHRVEYHGSGTESNFDEVTTTTAYVPRSGLDKPVRPSSVTVSDASVSRTLAYTYPDTWSGGGTWASGLRSAHALGLVLRKDFSTSAQGLPAKTEITEYGEFPIGGRRILMPSVHRELCAGVESWSEEIRDRDSYGNAATVKETGRPETAILWGWNGLFPVTVSENASMAGAHVTTFTWDPAVGLTSTTDPAGVTTSYEYDGNGRLACVRDGDGSAVTGFAYSLLNDGTGRLSVRSRTYRNAPGTGWSEDVKWFNTLGMLTEEIAVAGAGDGRDLVTARECDFMLHDDAKVWLPYPAATSGGSFQTGASSAASSYHSNNLAYSSRTYERSAHDRVLASAEPGYAGSHETEHSLESLGTCPRYTWGSGGVTQSGTFAASSLVKEVTTGPDGLVSYTVRDHAGRVIATGSGSDSPTYYVYDGRDRLMAVMGGGTAVSDTLNMWRYSYDSKDRVCSKGVPGSAMESYEYYDENGCDGYEGMLKSRHRGNGTTEYIYDCFGRVTQEKYREGGSAEKVMVENTYDIYPESVSSLITAATGSGSWDGPSTGLKTVTTSAMANADGTVTEGRATTVWLYDAKARPVWVITGYSGGDILKENMTYDFSGAVTSDIVSHVHGGVTDVLTTGSTFDIRGRMASRTESLSAGGSAAAGVSTQYSYDALGRPSGRTCSVSGGVTLTTSDTYNLQQRLVSRTVKRGQADLYTETLGYDASPAYGDVSSRHDGLITKRTDSWAFPGGGSSTRTVGYAYDGSGRLSREHGPTANLAFSYDSRGNITSVSGGSAYTETRSYSGDRLTAITRSGSQPVSFTHDSFGRMTSDGLEGTDICYNHLDLPRKISVAGGTIKANYCYLADGTKVSALSSDGTGLVYRGPFTYRRAADGSLALESAACAEGRLTPGGAMLHLTDHLGSVVAVVRGSDGALYGASEYDAYGKRSSLTSAGTVPVPEGVTLRDGFTGKDDQSPDFGLAYADFGARQYSPALRRWLVPDPLSEKYYGISPYAYCGGDPVTRIDTDGQVWDTIIDVGSLLYDVGSAAYYHAKGDNQSARQQIKAAGVDLACALIPGVSAAYLRLARLADKGIDAIKLGRELGAFEKASEFGVNSYKSLKTAVTRKYGKNSGLEVHHLIEKRFATTLQVDEKDMAAIVLTPEEHQLFTQKWRNLIGYSNSNADIVTETASVEDIKKAARKVYEDYPEILALLELD